jgi:hypothetical protein
LTTQAQFRHVLKNNFAPKYQARRVTQTNPCDSLCRTSAKNRVWRQSHCIAASILSISRDATWIYHAGMKNNETENAASSRLIRRIIISVICVLGFGYAGLTALRSLGGAAFPFKAYDHRYITPTTREEGDTIVMAGMKAALEKYRYKTNDWVFKRIPDVRGNDVPGLMEQVLTNHQLVFELSSKSNPKKTRSVTVMRPNQANILHYRIAVKE